MSSADAVDREAAWLATAGDTLPALLENSGGPFDIVQAYYPRTPNLDRRALYVTRLRLTQPRFGGQRLITQYSMRLIVEWPLLSGTGSAEDEQRALDAAMDLVVQRITGFVHDKTHGGRFLSVAENPRDISIDWTPVEQTIPLGLLHAIAAYSADDPEIPG